VEYGFIRSDGSAATTGVHCDLLPHFLRVAVRALVVLYVLRLGGGDPHAFAVEPPLAYVTGDPEFICIVETTAGRLHRHHTL
jgi:hypothetical protein